MIASRIFLIFSGLVLLGYAAAFLIDPHLLGKLVGFEATSPNALTEVTAFYGGLELGLAVFLFWSALRRERVRYGLALFVMAFLLAGLSRVFGLFLHGFAGSSQPIAAAVEVGMSSLGIWLYGRVVRLEHA